MITSSSAEDLLVRTKSRDPYAFEEFYDLLHGPVLKYVNRVVRDWAQSEEIVQEVFLEVWRSAARFAPARGSARTWVLRIAHFRAVDRIRLENNRRSREASVSSDSSITYDSVQKLVEVRSRRSEAERFLDLLTELQRCRDPRLLPRLHHARGRLAPGRTAEHGEEPGVRRADQHAIGGRGGPTSAWAQQGVPIPTARAAAREYPRGVSRLRSAGCESVRPQAPRTRRQA